MKRLLTALTLAATVGLGVALGPSGAAYADGNRIIFEVSCDTVPLYTDPALTVPAAFIPHHLERFYLAGSTETSLKVEGPIRAVPVPTTVYYAGSKCWHWVGLHI